MNTATKVPRLWEVERRYPVAVRLVGDLCTKLVGMGFSFADTLHLDNAYPPKPDANTSPRLRIQVSAVTGKKVYFAGKKTKTQIPDVEGVKLEEEEQISQVEYASKLGSAKGACQGELPGNRKQRLVYTGKLEQLEVNVYLDIVIITYDGRVFGPVLELETLLDDAAKVREAITQLERLAVQLLGPSPTRVAESCRKMSEPEKKEKKKKKKKKEKK